MSVPATPPIRWNLPSDDCHAGGERDLRLDLDKLPEVAVLSGSAHVEGAQITPVEIGANQSIASRATAQPRPTRSPNKSIPIRGINGTVIVTRRSRKRLRNKPRFATTPATQTMRIGTIWTITVTGIRSRTTAMFGCRAAWMQVGTPLAPVTGATIPALELRGSPGIRGDGCHTIAAVGITSRSDGAGLPEAAAWVGRRSSGFAAMRDISCRCGRSSPALDVGAFLRASMP